MDNPQTLDAYHLLEVLGEGPYATVYRARSDELDDVAVKVFDPRMRLDPAFTAYFRRDVLTFSATAHPRLAPVLAYGLTRGTPYLVTPLLPGGPLPQTRLAPRHLVRIGRAVADALHYVHQHGQVHGAIKPTNIFPVASGAVVTPPGGRRVTLETVSPDQAAYILAYMSPERTVRRELGPASDIYSLGIVLYQAYSGALPFTGDTAADIAAAHLLGAPPLPHISQWSRAPELAGIILRCLRLDPADRYESARDLARDLAAIDGDLAAPADPLEATETAGRQ